MGSGSGEVDKCVSRGDRMTIKWKVEGGRWKETERWPVDGLEVRTEDGGQRPDGRGRLRRGDDESGRKEVWGDL